MEKHSAGTKAVWSSSNSQQIVTCLMLHCQAAAIKASEREGIELLLQKQLSVTCLCNWLGLENLIIAYPVKV